jgi:hypothetical protein
MIFCSLFGTFVTTTEPLNVGRGVTTNRTKRDTDVGRWGKGQPFYATLAEGRSKSSRFHGQRAIRPHSKLAGNRWHEERGGICKISGKLRFGATRTRHLGHSWNPTEGYEVAGAIAWGQASMLCDERCESPGHFPGPRMRRFTHAQDLHKWRERRLDVIKPEETLRTKRIARRVRGPGRGMRNPACCRDRAS